MDKTISLTANVESPILNIKGNKFKIIEATNPIQLKFDQSSEWITRSQGQGQIRENAFSRITLKSTTTQTVKISYGFDLETDETATVNSATATIEIGNNNNALADKSLATGGPTKIANSNSDRKMVTVMSSKDNTDDIRIGGSTTSATSGIPISAGDSCTIISTGEVYAYNTGSGTQTVHLAEVEVV